jgi:cysteine desulfurase
VAASHVLKAMDVGEDIARTAIRVSMGWTTDVADVDRFVEVWSGIHCRAQARRSASVPAAVGAAL